MPMKSADLYRELRAGLGGWFRAERFKRARASSDGADLLSSSGSSATNGVGIRTPALASS
jgi:hypothetical protein